MKISINVPSHKRAEILDTFRILPSAFYWIHRGEEKKYEDHNPGIIIKVLPDETRGNIAAVRNHILRDQFSDPENEAVLMIDDDVKYIGVWEGKRRDRIETEKAILSMIQKFTLLASELGVKLWGINVGNDRQIYREYTPFSMLSYISASFSCFLKGNELFYDERFSLKEDYDMSLQQLNKYRRMLRINKFYYEKKGAEQPGGCSFYRNVEKELAQIKLLQQKWGEDIVRHDDLTKSRSHSSKKAKLFDINPVIVAPIAGV